MFYRSMALIAALMFIAPGVGCARADSKKKAPQANDKATIQTPGGKTVDVKVELALTPAEQARGLMHREYLAPDAGMLFVFPEEKQQWFWMKNTLIELDMIFIKADMSVLGCVERAEPQTTTPRGVDGASKYVLEVVGGFCAKHKVAPGTVVRFDLPSLKKPETP